jgi:hypothetical protein
MTTTRSFTEYFGSLSTGKVTLAVQKRCFSLRNGWLNVQYGYYVYLLALEQFDYSLMRPSSEDSSGAAALESARIKRRRRRYLVPSLRGLLGLRNRSASGQSEAGDHASSIDPNGHRAADGESFIDPNEARIPLLLHYQFIIAYIYPCTPPLRCPGIARPRRVSVYVSPRLDVRLVADLPGPFPRNQVPPAVAQHLQFNPRGDYLPIVYNNGK